MAVILNGLTQFLDREAVTLEPPFVAGAWIWVPSTDADGNWFAQSSQVNPTGASQYRQGGWVASTNQVTGNSRAGGATTTATVSGGATETWQFVSVLWRANNYTKAYLGSTGGTNVGGQGPVSYTRTCIGASNRAGSGASSPQGPFLGRIGHAFAYDLSDSWWGADADAKQTTWEGTVLPELAAGKTPNHFPTGLAFWCPLISDGTDSSGNGNHFAATGSPTFSGDDVPGIVYPGGPTIQPGIMLASASIM